MMDSNEGIVMSKCCYTMIGKCTIQYNTFMSLPLYQLVDNMSGLEDIEEDGKYKH